MKTTQPTPGTQAPDRTLFDYIGLAARGFAMGAADVVPGVSGGTIAFILGIYEELIQSIRALTFPRNLALLAKFRFREAFEVFPWRFLLAIAVGILSAIFSLAHILEWALESHPALLWAFFFGLVSASIITVFHRVERWNRATIAALLVGTLGAYWIVGIAPSQTPDTWWFLFLSGAIAICAMILPGISGSFILVLLGKYQVILAAVTQRNLIVLFWVALGTIVGITTFAQILGWLFKRYHDLTVALLIGFMAGSLRKIWPWKKTLEVMIDRHGLEVPVVQANIVPVWNGTVMAALLLALLGVLTVVTLHMSANRKMQKE